MFSEIFSYFSLTEVKDEDYLPDCKIQLQLQKSTSFAMTQMIPEQYFLFYAKYLEQANMYTFSDTQS
jgi:hypothetical protein